MHCPHWAETEIPGPLTDVMVMRPAGGAAMPFQQWYKGKSTKCKKCKSVSILQVYIEYHHKCIQIPSITRHICTPPQAEELLYWKTKSFFINRTGFEYLDSSSVVATRAGMRFSSSPIWLGQRLAPRTIPFGTYRRVTVSLQRKISVNPDHTVRMIELHPFTFNCVTPKGNL